MVSRIFSREGVRLFLFSLVAMAFTSAAVAAPNAPTGLTTFITKQASSHTYAWLWTDNSTDETSFVISYRIGTSGAFSILYTANSPTPPNATGSNGVVLPGITALSVGTVIQFQVIAQNASGASAPTNITTITIPADAFAVPTVGTTAASSETAISTSWTDNSTTEDGEELELSSDGGTNYTKLADVYFYQTKSINITSLTPGTTYKVRLRAYKEGSPRTYTAYSNIGTATTSLNAPTGLAATAASESTVNLSWADNSAVEGGYAVYYKPTSGGSYTLLTYTAANATTYSVTGLTAGTAYDFQLAAAYQSTSIIESARSNTASATTKDGFTSGTAPPIFFNQAFSYQAVVTTGSARTSWSITDLPTGLTFNSSTGVVSGTPSVTGAFNCPMSATFANGWTASNTLQLRVIRAAAAPIAATTIGTQTLMAGGNTSIALTDKFSDPDSESAVRIVTNLGTMDFILYNSATPQTVTNFLSYVNAVVNNYNGAVFHRAMPGFVVQGGGFKVQSAPNNFSSIPTAPSPTNEPGISNLRGTVAMAKIGGNPNSATNQFFVNLGNNSSNLDRDSGSLNANGGFTAFARVAGSGLAVADAMAGLPTVNSTVNVDGTPNASLTDWPLTSASAAMDTTKVVSITSAAPVAVLSYAVTGNTNSAVASASISGTNVQINALSGGQTNLTVTATDLDGSTVSQTFTVTVNQVPAFTNGPPPSSALVGAAYNFAYTTSGFPAPTFSKTGTLPPGLTLSSAGVISGTPTTAGAYSNIVVTASNGIGTAPTQTISITVDETPAITSSAPAAGVVGTAYTHTYTATGSPAPTYSLTAGALPGGLSVSAAGVISGTPSTAGTFTGTITATNSAGTAPQAFSITINQAPAFTSGAPTSSGTYNTAYNFTCTASGSPAPTFSVATGTLPTGLSLSTAGVISGTPTAAGTYAGTLSASNGIGSAVTQSFNITIEKAAATVALGSLEQTYTGSPLAATSTTNPANLSVSYTYDGSSTAPTTAGSYAVVATINEPNYAGTASGTLVIAKAAGTVSLGSLAQTYDGTAKSATATTTPSGRTVNFTYDSSATPPTAAGSYAVVGTINDPNYTGSSSGTLVIAKATASLSLANLTATFDGSAHAATASTTPGGLSVIFTYDGSATAPTNAGSYAVAASINDANYQGTANGMLVISKATAPVSLGSLAQTYDGSAKAATATTTPSGLTVNFTYGGSSTAPANAGSYAVIGTISDTNYAGSSAGTLVIAKATANLSFNGLAQTYDGSPKPVSATTNPSGLTVNITYDGSATAPTNHGSYAIAASINEANYTGSATETLTISGQTASDWRSQHFSNAQITAGLAADDADPDGDSLKNLVEYALGLDPLVRTQALTPTRDANGLTLIFTRPKDLPDVTYGAQSTDNLGSWTPLTLEVISDGPVQTVRARDPLTSGNPSRRFMHLIFGAPAAPE